jgi:hypothetical protein
MKLGDLTPEKVVGRWIFYRRIRGAQFSKLSRSFVQESHPGGILGLVGGLVYSDTDYPRRPAATRWPWFEAFDELEIHAVVEPVANEPTATAPPAA